MPINAQLQYAYHSFFLQFKNTDMMFQATHSSFPSSRPSASSSVDWRREEHQHPQVRQSSGRLADPFQELPPERYLR
jgi:hypothetical protein